MFVVRHIREPRAPHAGAPHNPSTYIWVRSRFEVPFVTYIYTFSSHKKFFSNSTTHADVLRLARPTSHVRAGSRTTTPRHASLAPASRGPLAARHVAGTHATRSRTPLVRATRESNVAPRQMQDSCFIRTPGPPPLLLERLSQPPRLVCVSSCNVSDVPPTQTHIPLVNTNAVPTTRRIVALRVVFTEGIRASNPQVASADPSMPPFRT